METAFKRPLQEIYNSLAQPVPPHLIQLKKVEFKKKDGSRGSYTLDVLSWYDAADLMDERAPGWEMQVSDPIITGKNLLVKVSITIHGSDGSVTRENTGIESLNTDSYGDAFSNAMAMAFKRVCAMHGMGRDMWRNEDKYKQKGRRSSGDGAATAPPKLRKVESTKKVDVKAQAEEAEELFEEMKVWADSKISQGETVEYIRAQCNRYMIPKIKVPQVQERAKKWIATQWEVAG